jgi:hypothetical protein
MVSSRLITPKFVLSVSTDVGRNLTGERIRTTISRKMYFVKVKKIIDFLNLAFYTHLWCIKLNLRVVMSVLSLE